MKLLNFILLLLLFAAPAQAWWDEGHQLVALIAKDHLSESCRESVTEILAHHPDPRVKTLEQAAIWPDIIKEDDDPFHSFDRPDWHYRDHPIPDPEAGPHQGQLVKQIKKQGSILADTRASKASRAIALSWYTHLLGDIHQPLHNVSFYSEDFSNGDRGGNKYYVVLGQRPIALHILWDSVGGRFIESPPPGRLQSYSRRFQRTWPMKKLSESLSQADPSEWSQEGVRMSKELVYPQVKPGERISNSALQQTLDISEKQLCLAGYRLARELNKRLVLRRHHKNQMTPN